MTITAKKSVSRIRLQKPASISRQFPGFEDQGWMMPDFVFGPENASLKYLFDAESLGRLAALSPIVLYGEKSTGKTALAITLAVCWARHSKQRPLCFTTAASFTNDFLAAIEIDDLETFRSRHRSTQLLVIDDLERICRSTIAQTELALTIDSLRARLVPVIVTSNKLPAALEGLDSGLASRLSAGFSTCLCRPGHEASASIIEALADSVDDVLDTDSLTTFCRQSTTAFSAPQLLQIVQLAHQNRLPEGRVDVELLSQMVTQIVAGESLCVADIARSVAKRLKVRLSDLRGSTRQSKIVRARGLAMLLARRLTPASLQEIGQFFGGRDHSTVLHACRKTSASVDQDPELSKSFSELRTELLNS